MISRWTKKVDTIYGFYHICILNNNLQIMNEQIEKIRVSGLYNASKIIFCSVVGELPETFSLPEKYKIIYCSTDTSCYERKILEFMYNYSFNCNAAFWYIHTKGTSRTAHPKYNQMVSWRNYMEHFVIKRWQRCLLDLKTYSVVGVNYSTYLFPHFSGNFWWAHSQYIKTNPPNFKYDDDYFEPEMWLFKKNPLYKSYCQLNVDNWLQDYPEELYINI